MGRTSDARERLLGSAGELFHERGFNAVGVSDICAAAGVNKGSFYHFFPSKQQLALDVVDAYWHGTRQRLESHLVGDGPPLRRLRAYCRSLYDDHRAACACSGLQRGCALANLGLEMATQDPVLRDRVGQAFDAQIGYFERLLREARDAGQVAADLDPRRTAVSLVALVEGRILLSKVHNDPALLADLETEAMRLVGDASPGPAAG